jgi:hypothetical protein
MVLLGTESNGYFSRISPAQGQKLVHITHELFGMIKTGMSLQTLIYESKGTYMELSSKNS